MTDAAVLSKKTRGVIMVAASGRAKKQEVTGAIRSLDTAGGNLLGVVMTMLPTKGPDSYGYGYGAYTYGTTHVHEQDPITAPTVQVKGSTARRAARAK